MFERLTISEIGEIGFVIAPIVRHNLYKTPQIFNDWTGTEFDAILKSVKRRLRPSTGSAASKPSSSVASDASINKPVTQKWKETEATEVDRSPQRPGSQLLGQTDLTQKEIKCEKYSTPCNCKFIY